MNPGRYWKDNVLLQPGIRRDFALIFILFALVGSVATATFKNYIDRHVTYTHLVNTAGRLRMLSQRIAYQVHHLDAGSIAARTKLRQLVESFDENLENLSRLSEAMGVFRDTPATAETSLESVRRGWRDYRNAALALAEYPVGSLQAALSLRVIDGTAEELLDVADNNVSHILGQGVREYQQLETILPISLLLGLLLAAGAYRYLQQRFLKPLALIGSVSRRLAVGDLDARVEYRSKGEVATLIKTLNLTADAMRDLLNERQRAEALAQESEQQHRAILETSHDAIVVTDRQGLIRYANQSVGSVFGYSPEELIGSDVFQLYPERSRTVRREAFLGYLATGKHSLNGQSGEIWGLHKSGREICLELAVSHIRLLGGDLFAGFFRDQTARYATLEELHLRDRAIESAGLAVLISDARAADHPTTYVNPAFERMTGYTKEELLGNSGRILLGNELAQYQADELRQLLKEGKEGTVILKCFRKDGQMFWNELSVSPVRNGQGTITHCISISKDVTERKREEENLIRNAQYDCLTGLPNRILFHDRLEQSIASATRHQRLVGVLFIDLDRFKVINDSIGLAAGDQVLVEAALRLKHCLRDGDTVGRLGSDQFVLLLDELEHADAIETLADRVLASISKAFTVAGQEVFVSASIGASIFPRDGDDGPILIRHADMAMYRAKQYGRNNYQVFSEEMETNIARRVTLEANLRRALDRDEFVLYYQPQVSLESGRIVGAEALIRWRHPELGMVPPAQFIPLAEETGMIVPIGEWVLDTVCAQLKTGFGMGLKLPRVAVNISARQFRQKNLLAFVEQCLRNHGVDAASMEIELTESMVMLDPERTIQVLRNMKEMGLRISLDDFGTGYSSLSYLRRFPIDVLKVDQSFVRDVTSNKDDAAIASSIIALAHSLNLSTVAEGVETIDQLDYLALQKCDVMQGYFFSKPVPAACFSRMLQSGQSLGGPGDCQKQLAYH